MQFAQFSPTKLLFGPGMLSRLADEPMPGTKALLLTTFGRSTITNGSLARTQEALNKQGIPFTHLACVEPNPLCTTVMKAAEVCRRDGCNFIVALGGGSVMDAAKAVAIMATNPGTLWDYMQQGTGGRKPIAVDPLPLVAITTTAGTGSEVDGGGVISNPDTREKMAIGGHINLFPKLAVVDPELMLTVPPALTAYQGFDALFHAVEGYVTKRPTWLSDMYALEAVRHIAAGLAASVKNGTDLEARTHVAFANTLSGYVMTMTRLTSQHAMEHALSAFHPELPHGAGLIMLSLAYFGHMIQTGARAERFVELARALGVRDAVHPQDLLRALHELQRACGVDQLKMSEWGIKLTDLPALAENARSAGASAFEQDPVALTFEDTVSIYHAAWR